MFDYLEVLARRREGFDTLQLFWDAMVAAAKERGIDNVGADSDVWDECEDVVISEACQKVAALIEAYRPGAYREIYYDWEFVDDGDGVMLRVAFDGIDLGVVV